MSGMSMHSGYFCRPMSSALRHMILLAFVFVTAEHALLWGRGLMQDSLQVKVLVTPIADSVLSDVSLSPFYAISEGPRAFDHGGQRAFYLMATSGPFGELDMVAVDAGTGQMLESPGVCGFIGDCPAAFAYSTTGPSVG